MSNRLNSLIKNKTILQSNTSGPFIIIKDLGKVNGRNRVIIKYNIRPKTMCKYNNDN